MHVNFRWMKAILLTNKFVKLETISVNCQDCLMEILISKLFTFCLWLARYSQFNFNLLLV